MSPHRDLERIFKAYDVRGVVPEDLDEEAARRIGSAFADWADVRRIAVGYDCRISSPARGRSARTRAWPRSETAPSATGSRR